MVNLSIGIDIGGTNTSFGIVDESGNIYKEKTLSTFDYVQIEDLISTLAKDIYDELASLGFGYELCGIGIGAPNGNYYKGTIENAPNIPWKGHIPLKKLFEAKFSGIPVFVTNDANAAALGEKIYGKAKNLKEFVVVTLGTGVGSGFVVNGKILYGHDSFAGELGHTIIDPEGRLCGCGRRGCLETYASATGFMRTTKSLINNYNRHSLLKEVDVNDLRASDVTAAAKQGDKLALQIFDFTAQKLGFSLSNMVAITSPQTIILFGGLAQAGDLLLVPTKRYMEQYLLNIFQNKVELTNSELDSNYAAILGAAAMVWQEKNEWVK